MKNNGSKLHSATTTLAQLVATVGEMTHNDQLTALIVADMINSRMVKLGGDFANKRVVVELPDAKSHAKSLASRRHSANGKRRELVAA